MLRDPVAPSVPASTQMPTPLQLTCCKVSVKACCMSIPVETLMKLWYRQYANLQTRDHVKNSPHVTNSVLLIAEQDANVAANEAQIAHEESRSAA